MDEKGIIKAIIHNQGVTYEQVSAKLGYASKDSLKKRLNSDMRISTLRKIVESLGYTIVIKDCHREYEINDDFLPVQDKLDDEFYLNWDKILSQPKKEIE